MLFEFVRAWKTATVRVFQGLNKTVSDCLLHKPEPKKITQHKNSNPFAAQSKSKVETEAGTEWCLGTNVLYVVVLILHSNNEA